MTRKEARRPSGKKKPSPERDVNVAPAGYDNGSAGAFRDEASMRIIFAANLLTGNYLFCDDAGWATRNNLPDVALRRIARAEAEIRRAKKALNLWAKSR